MTKFQVSVTIPVYNAANYVQRAVESALLQPETAEVVLVEDGSSDNSWDICQKLAARHAKVHLFRHPDGRNHGCSASRNLAIKKSSYEYIAFLDADDFFLPNRFTIAKSMFEADADLEGVYEAVGMYVENEEGLERWRVAGRSESPLHTMTKYVPPEKLFSVLVTGEAGSFSIDGLVLKRSVFKKTGYFDESVPLHMDDVQFMKLSAMAKLMPGRLDEPVAMWSVHNNNRISAPRPPAEVYKGKLMYWDTLWRWSRENLDEERQQLVLDCFLRHAAFSPRFKRTLPRWARGLQKRIQLGLLLFDYPALAREPSYWQCFVPNPRLLGHRLYSRLVQKSRPWWQSLTFYASRFTRS